MQIVRRYEPDEERQIEALLLLLRSSIPPFGGATLVTESDLPAHDEGEDQMHPQKPRRGARGDRSTAA